MIVKFPSLEGRLEDYKALKRHGWSALQASKLIAGFPADLHGREIQGTIRLIRMELTRLLIKDKRAKLKHRQAVKRGKASWRKQLAKAKL